eukprot:3167805-Rhodomonas_salina.1
MLRTTLRHLPSYAMSGTDIGTRAVRDMACFVLIVAICLRACYEVLSTIAAYGAMRAVLVTYTLSFCLYVS